MILHLNRWPTTTTTTSSSHPHSIILKSKTHLIKVRAPESSKAALLLLRGHICDKCRRDILHSTFSKHSSTVNGATWGENTKQKLNSTSLEHLPALCLSAPVYCLVALSSTCSACKYTEYSITLFELCIWIFKETWPETNANFLVCVHVG